jgi:lipopolysaccharide export LptBFGC system permease protein LptF
MELTEREIYTVIHGLILGTLFLLAFGGGFAGLWSLRGKLVTDEGVKERTPRLLIGTALMAVVAWLTVLTGTFIAYPWYRAAPPAGTDLKDPAVLGDYPRYLLLAQEKTAGWHEFGMEWKEHVAWIAPFLATAVAFAVAYYGVQLIRRGDIRRGVMIFFVLAFVAAGVAGLFGAFITKAAPVA